LDTILSKASRRFSLAQPLQLGLAILGIALGVAVVTSVDIARVSAALLAGIYPARRAARSSPAAVLRND
jgi:ABC-type lipoprotein release transport system permease subunit